MREERFLAMVRKGPVPFGILIFLRVLGGPGPLAGQEDEIMQALVGFTIMGGKVVYRT